MRISDWSSDVCSSDLGCRRYQRHKPLVFGELSPLGARQPAHGILAIQQLDGLLVAPVGLAFGIAIEEVVLERARLAAVRVDMRPCRHCSPRSRSLARPPDEVERPAAPLRVPNKSGSASGGEEGGRI